MALELARMAFLAGDVKTGQAVLSRLNASKYHLTPDMLNREAGIYDEFGMPANALETLNRAGDSIFHSLAAAIYMADLKARTGDFAGAERAYRTVLAKAPGHSAASLGLAQLLAWHERAPEAEDICRSLLAREPKNKQARIVLGRILTAEGRIEEAIDEYRKALESAP